MDALKRIYSNPPVSWILTGLFEVAAATAECALGNTAN